MPASTSISVPWSISASIPGTRSSRGASEAIGADPNTVTSLARSFIAAHREANVVTVAKHFPGHGSSWSDSHKTLPDISRSWQESELEPYVTLAHDGLLDMVMVGHLYHPRFSDGDKLPSSLSANAIERSAPRAISAFTAWWSATIWRWARCASAIRLEDRVIRALNAGVDLLVFSNVKSRDTELGVKVHAIIAASGARRAHSARAASRPLMSRSPRSSAA